MTTFLKQTFIDVDSAELFQRAGTEWDIVQLKYDGHWQRLEFDSSGHGIGYTTSSRIESTVDELELSGCVAIGEHMFGTNWAKQRGREGGIVLFDLVVCHDEDISQQPYSKRWDKLSRLLDRVSNPKLFLASTKAATLTEAVWSKFVMGVPQFEGLVLRKWNQPYSAQIHRCKRDVEVTYVCVAFNEGQGKHAGRLGALVGLPRANCAFDATGKFVGSHMLPGHSVGGGFSDEDRDYIWSHQSEFLGREFDATGKQLFESGALRHPNFVRWK